MDYTIKNLEAGLKKLRKPGSQPYIKAIIAYNEKIAAGKSKKAAISETLKGAAITLSPSTRDEKLKAARIAAGLQSPLQSVKSAATTTTTAVITKVKTVKVRKSLLRRIMDRRPAKKARASNDPTAPVKARKWTIVIWTSLGILIGLVITFLLNGVLLNIRGGTGSFPWVPYLVFPFVVPFFFLFGYRKAIRPNSTDDSEDGPFASTTAHDPA